MNSKFAFASIALLATLGGKCFAAGTEVEIVDELEISADTNITVEAGRTLRLEYVRGDNEVTLTKSGAGRLEIASSSHRGLSVEVAEGTLAAVKPEPIPLTADFRPTLRIDASMMESTFTLSASGGTNFITKIADADGRTDFCLKSIASWGWEYRNPYVASETLNGKGLIDFGTLRKTTKPAEGEAPNPFLDGYGGCIGVSPSMKVGEYFYVWKDRDDAIDAAPEGIRPDTGFVGPTVMGNHPALYFRGYGGFGKGFPAFTVGMSDTVKKHLRIDGRTLSEGATYTERLSRGFHVLRNRLKEDQQGEFSMVGRTIPHNGGFLLAELVAYTNKLSDAASLRIESQLTSKWLGFKFAAVTLRENTALDASGGLCDIAALNVTGRAAISGLANMKIGSLAKNSAAVAVEGPIVVDGSAVEEIPDVIFGGDGEIAVTGAARVDTLSASSDRFVKSGSGTLKIAEPLVGDIKVEEGVLDISALYVRTADFHVDAARTDTFDWREGESGQLIAAWRDVEDPARRLSATTYRTYPWGDKSLWRLPFLTENAAGSLPMVDFGTYANANHTDGYGASLELVPVFNEKKGSGSHDTFIVWKDYPEVKDYPLNENGTEFFGPCFLGMQYHWCRGKGGAGNSFAVHYLDAPGGMYSSDSGDDLVVVDGSPADARRYRVGDGVHVLAQRAYTVDKFQGAPIEQMGGDFQRHVYGGLMVGEFIAFTNMLSGSRRMRISGALCSKWRGDANEWAYDSLEVSPGAELKHPYADLVPVSLELAGKISAASVRPGSFRCVGGTAEIDGVLKLADGGSLTVTGDFAAGFAVAKARSVRASGKGAVSLDGTEIAELSAHVGEKYRIIESDDVSASGGFRWRSALPAGSGVRVSLEAKSDGIYLSVENAGMMILLK